MNNDVILGNDFNFKNNDVDLDDMFQNLTNDIANFNSYINNVQNQKQENNKSELELTEEKLKLSRAKTEFDNYIKIQQEEFKQKQNKFDIFVNKQKDNLMKAEEEFKTNMNNTLAEFELNKKEFEMQKNKFEEDKKQFEQYKNIEIERIHHLEEIFESDKKEFEQYKEITTKKLELENANLEQKCAKFRNMISQFNSNFRPIIEDNGE